MNLPGLRCWALSVALVCSLHADTRPKKRVAVFDFDNAAARGGIASPYSEAGAPNLGKAVVDLLVNHLVESGAVSVIERSALDKVLAEQNFANSDRADAKTAAEIGRILGVDAIVLGSITHYDYDDRMTGGSRGGFGPFVGTSMTTKHDIKARVQISARIVSPDTAEVVSVAQGVGEISKKGVKVDMRDMRNVVMAGMTGQTNPLMNEAMDAAVIQLTGQVTANLAKTPPRKIVVEGLVADANAERLILNVGSRQGLKAGDALQVWRPGKEIRDPATQRILMRDDRLLGEVVVVSVQEGAAVAKYSGAETVAVGDLVKSKS